MIVLPSAGLTGADWPPEGAEGGSFLTGAPAPLPLGTFRLPDDPHLLAADVPGDDPVTRADTLRERAGQVFERQRAIGGFNRDLDDLFANIAEGTDWSQGPPWLSGLGRFDKEIGNLRQKHLAELRTPEDRAAFERHSQEFAAMQRIDLKRALVERQHADALVQLDGQLAYYAGRAAAAPNDVFRQIAIGAGERAIAELRDAGYLFPEGAEKRTQAFRGLIDGADLESIVNADPGEAAGLLDNPALFSNADAAMRERLKHALNSARPTASERVTPPREEQDPIQVAWADVQVPTNVTPIASIVQLDQCVAQNGLLGSFSIPQGTVDVCTTGPTMSTLGPGQNPTVAIEVESGSVMARDPAGDVHSAAAGPGQTATMTINTETGQISVSEPGQDI